MKTVKCPKCRNPAQWNDNPHRPFCSEECKQRDLGGWANEEYSVPDERTGVPEEGSEPDEG